MVLVHKRTTIIPLKLAFHLPHWHQFQGSAIFVINPDAKTEAFGFIRVGRALHVSVEAQIFGPDGAKSNNVPLPISKPCSLPIATLSEIASKMIDDQDLGFFANFLGVFIFVLVIAYHFVMADPKFEGN
ncbi:hypothetical protein VNO78_11059 [Psophocarpus tetragonolobus]|uniref:Dolichyl-diphosphooligosaccharide--protein glycosyltransferase subunit 4 n=1 Tax=Psophocarpus tetragonolobus TaxID=3891 RepID=A0AAN9XNB3_PSOTE